MKKLLYALPGSLIIFSAVFAAHLPLAAAENKTKERPVTIYTQSEFKLSQERMKIIDEVLNNAINRNLDMTKPATLQMLESEISRKMPLIPKVPVSNKSHSQFAAEAKKLVRDNATSAAELTALRAAAEKEAAEKYPLEKPRAKVKFEYKKGPYIEKVEGTFYGAFDRYVQIDGKRISYVDLPEELRARFDRKFNAEKRKTYVEQKVREWERKKAQEEQEKFTELLAGQDLLNEKNGYIYDRSLKQWITAKDYLQSQMPAAIVKYQAYVKEQQEKERQARERDAARAQAQQGTRNLTGIDTSDESKYKKYRDEAAAKRKKIQQQYSGVDAYQGFRNAMWGASREEVAYLFSKISGTRYEQRDFHSKLTLPRYFPAEVVFEFNQNQLIEVVLHYGYLSQVKGSAEGKKPVSQRLFKADDFNNLIISLHDICGLSEEEKLAGSQNLFKEIAEGKMTPEKLHPADAGQEPATCFIFKWIGQDTDMILSFSYDPVQNIYVDVQLTKRKKNITR